METNTQQLIIAILGITLILTVIMKYPTEIITTIIAGLIGFLSTKTLTEKQSQDMQTDINRLNNDTNELNTITEEEQEKP